MTIREKSGIPENKLNNIIGMQYNNVGGYGFNLTSCNLSAANRNKILNSILTSKNPMCHLQTI
jgi:hypothetical protein